MAMTSHAFGGTEETIYVGTRVCALVALLLLVFATRVAVELDVAVRAVMIAVLGTGAWALLLHVGTRHGQLRRWLLGVMAVNVTAAGLIAALALTRPLDAFSLLLLLIAVEVAAFAASQAVALRATGA